MLSLKMNIKCENDEMDEFIYIDKNKNNTCTETQFPECSESSSSTSFIYTPSALDDVQWLLKKTWFFIEERFKREKKFQNPKSHVDKYWNENQQNNCTNETCQKTLGAFFNSSNQFPPSLLSSSLQ